MKSRSGSHQSGRKPSFFGRFCIFLLVLVLFAVALVGLAVFSLNWYLTPGRVENISSRLLKEHLGQNLEMQGVHFSIFNGFEFRNIRLYPDSSTDSDFPLTVKHAARIQFKYSLVPLLRKQLVFHKLVIDSADFTLNIPMPPPQDSDSADVVRDEKKLDSVESDIPITVDIREISLNHAEIRFSAHNDTSQQTLHIGNISLNIKEFYLPRGNVLAPEAKVRGDFKLSAENSPVRIEQTTPSGSLSLNTNLNFVSNLTFRSLSDILLQMNTEISELSFEQVIQDSVFRYKLPFPVSLQTVAVLDGHRESIIFNPIALQIGQYEWLQIQGKADSLSTRPFIDFKVIESRIPLKDVLTLARPFIPDTLLWDYYLHNPNSYLSLKGTGINGYAPHDTSSLPWTLHSELKLDRFGITVNSGEALLQNFNLSAQFTSKLSGLQHQSTEPHIILHYDSLFVKQPQSIPVTSGPGRLDIKTQLTRLFYPSRARFTLDFPNIMNAALFSRFNLYSRNGGVQGLTGSGTFELAHLDLEQIPDFPLAGHFDTKIDFTANTLDSMTAHILCSTDELTFYQDDLSYSIPPLRLDNHLRVQSDTLFQNITIDSFHVALNDILSAQARASINVTRGILFSFEMPELALDHHPLLEILPLPASVKNDIALSGVTRLQAEAQGHLGIEGMNYAASVQLNMDSTTKIITPDAELSGVSVHLTAELDEKVGVAVNGTLTCKEALLESMRSQPFYNTNLDYRFNTTDFIHYHIDTTVLTVPDLYLKAMLLSDVYTLPSTAGTARAQVNLSPPRMIDVTDDVSLIGSLNADVQVDADTSQIGLTAAVNGHNINLYFAPGGIVENIQVDLFVDQGFDLNTGLFTGRDYSLVQTPFHSAPDYALHQDYFSRQEKSIITIDSLKIGAYRLTEAVIEGYLGRGHVEIPNFYVNLYDGNIGGRFSMDAAGKAPDQVTFRLSSHIAGINSALMMPDTPGKKKESVVNANTEIDGKSIDPQAGIDLNGYFYITTIGSKFADNLLRSMDPKGKDSGIRSARMLLNRGLKPRLFSFEIQNGYFYPSISFKQPWYMPVRLSGSRIEFTRIPINYLFQ
ncbi:MAG: hypothetical protein U5R06_22300 [candidate division KSB1 bacterium]|nr:hypothetical protein [candidate division KSB1 bacterium]